MSSYETYKKNKIPKGVYSTSMNLGELLKKKLHEGKETKVVFLPEKEDAYNYHYIKKDAVDKTMDENGNWHIDTEASGDFPESEETIMVDTNAALTEATSDGEMTQGQWNNYLDCRLNELAVQLQNALQVIAAQSIAIEKMQKTLKKSGKWYAEVKNSSIQGAAADLISVKLDLDKTISEWQEGTTSNESLLDAETTAQTAAIPKGSLELMGKHFSEYEDELEQKSNESYEDMAHPVNPAHPSWKKQEVDNNSFGWAKKKKFPKTNEGI